jgi:formylglycine-generating enzyme required for sulfatase activity
MGNRSSGAGVRGVPRLRVRLPGALVRADICVPRAHPHALWLLPWVEGLLSGRTLESLAASPPWPMPRDPLVVRHLQYTLFELGWARPDWRTGEVTVSPELAATFGSEGRGGLARVLFDAEVVSGEWWADGLGGTLLSRQTAAQFDWDGRRAADAVLDATVDTQALIDAGEADLWDLIRKLGRVEILWEARDRAFLASPIVVVERKDILFALFGADERLLPDELGELEPVLRTHAPELLGRKRDTSSRVVRLPRSPVEQLGAEIEALPTDPVMLGPIEPVRARVEHLAQLVRRIGPELDAWLRDGHRVHPIAGPTQRHFDALAEMCGALAEAPAPAVLLTSAFLSAQNAEREGGLADALLAAPPDTRFLLVYGHANDDRPEEQRRDMDAWRRALLARAPALGDRVTVAAGAHRSHEKVILTSLGHWMVGSWNPASSRPEATVFEASLAGEDPRFAKALLDRVGANVEGADGERLVARLASGLRSAPTAPAEPGVRENLARALALLERALPGADGARSGAWEAAVLALRAAFAPFVTTTRLELADEYQTRDAVLAHLRSARHDVLLASDRLADSALDGATLRDLRGDGAARRVVRVVWGREWAGGRAPSDKAAREQLRRARDTVRSARERLGDWLRTSEEPMENHAKLLLVDGLRGLLTSENILSYGGEKGVRVSRELGLLFWSPALARHLQGRLLLQWPEQLDASAVGRSDGALLCAVAGNEVWHGLAAIAPELDFDWEAPSFVQAAVEDELARTETDELPRTGGGSARLRAAATPFSWAHAEAARLGLVHPSPLKGQPCWRPYDAPPVASPEELLAVAEAAVATLPVVAQGRPLAARPATHPLVARVLADMRRIPAGAFWMGDDRVPDDRPRHRVHITAPFLLGRTPVTQGVWQEVMGGLPHLRDVERHPEFPIIQITRADMDRFVARLNDLPGGGGFELPTEAQWEYACRAGTETHYSFGNDPGWGDAPGLLERYAWTKRNAGGRLQRVGTREPNAFGLHDMHGLVYEALRDCMRPYTRAEVRDPVGPSEGKIAARGGFWGRFPVDPRNPTQEHFRSASRQFYEKSHRVSVRLACRVSEGA